MLHSQTGTDKGVLLPDIVGFTMHNDKTPKGRVGVSEDRRGKRGFLQKQDTTGDQRTDCEAEVVHIHLVLTLAKWLRLNLPLFQPVIATPQLPGCTS